MTRRVHPLSTHLSGVQTGANPPSVRPTNRHKPTPEKEDPDAQIVAVEYDGPAY